MSAKRERPSEDGDGAAAEERAAKALRGGEELSEMSLESVRAYKKKLKELLKEAEAAERELIAQTHREKCESTLKVALEMVEALEKLAADGDLSKHHPFTVAFRKAREAAVGAATEALSWWVCELEESKQPSSLSFEVQLDANMICYYRDDVDDLFDLTVSSAEQDLAHSLQDLFGLSGDTHHRGDMSFLDVTHEDAYERLHDPRWG